MTIADAIYALCALTSLAAALLLLRHYRSRKSGLLLWSCIAFAGLAVNNMLVLIDLGFFPATVDLSLVRSLTGALSMLILGYGLVWEAGS